MRATFALVLTAALGACGSGGPDGDDEVTPDGEIPDEPELTLVSPDTLEIPPGIEITYCWHFRTSNTKPLAIKKWASSMPSGAHHLILYTGQSDAMPPGTVTTVNCGPGGSGFSTWMYSSQIPEDSLEMPTDDGEGKPLAMEIAPNQAGFLQMHYTNRTDTVLKPRITVTAQALPEGAAYTRTAAFTTFNTQISIPAGAMSDLESQTCNVVPATSKFWMVTTHAHKHATKTAVKDGTTTIFESTDWEHPGATRWEFPYYTFSSGKLTYECTYNNTTGRMIRTGDSAQTDEMCMASGYFFPATRPVFCYDSITL